MIEIAVAGQDCTSWEPARHISSADMPGETRRWAVGPAAHIQDGARGSLGQHVAPPGVPAGQATGDLCRDDPVAGHLAGSVSYPGKAFDRDRHVDVCGPSLATARLLADAAAWGREHDVDEGLSHPDVEGTGIHLGPRVVGGRLWMLGAFVAAGQRADCSVDALGVLAGESR